MASFEIEFGDGRDKVVVEDVRLSDQPATEMNLTAPGTRDLAIAFNKFVISGITISGVPIAHVPPQILPTIRGGNTIAIRVWCPNSETLDGTIGITSFTQQPAKDGQQRATIVGKFVGRKDQVDEKKLVKARHGLVIDMHDGTSFTFNCQDIRSNAAYRPFFMDGLSDTNTTVPDAIRTVIEKQKQGDISAYQHTHPGDDDLMILSASGKRWDYDSVAGALMYGHGPRSCASAAPTVTVGYTEDKIKRTITCGLITLIKSVKTQVPVYSIRIPCVWDGPDMPQQPASVGYINSSGFSIFGYQFDALTLRSDGFDFQPYEAPDGIYYAGSIRYFHKPDGWKKGQVICIKWDKAALPDVQESPLQAEGTEPGYIMNAEHTQLYVYDSAGFEPLSQLCSRCYPEPAVG